MELKKTYRKHLEAFERKMHKPGKHRITSHEFLESIRYNLCGNDHSFRYYVDLTHVIRYGREYSLRLEVQKADTVDYSNDMPMEFIGYHVFTAAALKTALQMIEQYVQTQDLTEKKEG